MSDNITYYEEELEEFEEYEEREEESSSIYDDGKIYITQVTNDEISSFKA